VVAALVLLLGAAGCKGPPSRAKTDQVVLENGDTLTGEIKQLDQGKLRLKTSDLGTVYIEWNKIARIDSRYGFSVEEQSGARASGNITSEAVGRLTIVHDDGTRSDMALEEIVGIMPVDEEFLARIDGNLSLGYNYNKGSDVAQGIASGTVNYRERIRRHRLDFSSTITRDSTEVTTSRNTLDAGTVRYWDRWSVWGAGSLEQNEALGLDLRALISGGGGRSLILTGRQRLDVGLGLALTNERYQDEPDNPGEVEGVVRASYALYVFEEKDVDSDFTLYLYPGITRSGRLRGEFDASVSREIISNVTLKLSAYYSYDNEPAEGSTGKDYGINTSLGWSF
jgi:hypothetical protein